MVIVKPGEDAPKSFTSSIFLAGPTYRDAVKKSWRIDALEILRSKGFDGVVFVPEPFIKDGYSAQVAWEDKCLNQADCILFWVPRSEELPGFTTNVEYGEWFGSGKIVLGFPPDADRVRYLESKAKLNSVPVSNTLEKTIATALLKIGPGAQRSGGECFVPLYVWRTKSFQNWYKAQRKAGNRLDGAKLLWNFRVGANKENMFSWVLHVDIFISKENRHKTNEFVFARPDIACVVVTCLSEENFFKSKIIIIKEFRSPVANSDCFVRELPGGSSKDTTEEMAQVISHELKEETGLIISSNRFEYVKSRQICSTLSAHRAHLFSVSLNNKEISAIEKQVGSVHGVVEDTERTYLEVYTLEQILDSNLLDWSMVGMVAEGMLSAKVIREDKDWMSTFLN